MSEQIEREIEAILEDRIGRECVFMPSGRFAVYLAFHWLLSPGDRILMSPLEDDTVFFGALAAGLRPVMAPVSTDDGNMRIDALDDATWSTSSAVLTGNTYGLPDRVVELSGSRLKRTLGRLRDLGRDREERIAGVLRLQTLEAVAPAARQGDPLPLLRVPLLVEDRDVTALELRRRGINVFFIYAPPLDEYSGPEFCEPSPLPEAARWWAAHVLPIDPHDAERVLELVGKNQIRLTPAAPPPV